MDSFQNLKIIFFIPKEQIYIGKRLKKHRPESAELEWQNGKRRRRVAGAPVYIHTGALFFFSFLFLHKPLCTTSGPWVRRATWGSLDLIWSGARACVCLFSFFALKFVPHVSPKCHVAKLRGRLAETKLQFSSCVSERASPEPSPRDVVALLCPRLPPGAGPRRDAGQRWSRSVERVSAMSRPSYPVRTGTFWRGIPRELSRVVAARGSDVGRSPSAGGAERGPQLGLPCSGGTKDQRFGCNYRGKTPTCKSCVKYVKTQVWKNVFVMDKVKCALANFVLFALFALFD